MKNKPRPFYGYFVMIGVLALLSLIGFFLPKQSEAKDAHRITFQVGDDLVKITPQGTVFATVLELGLPKKSSQEFLAARIRMNGDNSHISIERPAYVRRSENVSVGERVIAHCFLQEDSRGPNDVVILTKDSGGK